MGKGVANPTAAILSAAMLLDWLGRRHRFGPCQDAARKIEAVVEETLAENPEVIASSAAMGGEVLTRLKR